MKFKKGDIVEVIEKDTWDGLAYLVGTQWWVASDQINNTVDVFDSMQNKYNGQATLWADNLKLIKREGEKELEFKIGDKVYGQNRHNKAWLETETVKLLLELVEAKEEAEFLLECFIERVTK